jgi:hypothetical protein
MHPHYTSIERLENLKISLSLETPQGTEGTLAPRDLKIIGILRS